MCISSQCSLLKRVFMGSRLLSRFGWLIIAVLSFVLLVFSSLALVNPWWAIDYTKDCEPQYYVIMLQFGMCQTSASQKSTQDNSDCTAWNDSEEWDEVNASSGVNTDRSVRHVYPAILCMTYALVSMMGMQVLVCLYQWKKMKESIWIQRFVLFSTFSYWLVAISISGISGNTSVANEDTWKYTNQCTNSVSYPGIGNILLITFGTIVTYVTMFIINFPEKIWCCHLIRNDQPFRNGRTATVGENVFTATLSDALLQSTTAEEGWATQKSIGSITYRDPSLIEGSSSNSCSMTEVDETTPGFTAGV